MLKIEMVRCYVTSPSPQAENPEGAGKQVRYIPKEIFRLWRFLMERVKGFEVTEQTDSFWVDEEMYSREQGSFGEHETEKVVQVYFQYFKDAEGGRPVIRYFPYDYFNQIMQFFMRNFSDEYIKADTERTFGYFVIRE
jgi:hypothetical protein